MVTKHDSECICPGDVPVCPDCGRRWTYVIPFSDGSKAYMSKSTRDKFAILYGEEAASRIVSVAPVRT